MSLVIQGVNVYLTDCGSGSPILFLHGAPDSAEMWRGVIEQLKDQHQCFAPDLPGFGRSAAPANFNCSLENMARFLDTFIEEAAIPTPLNLVVADFGATYGLSWAVTYPQKVGRLAIVGGSNFSSRYRWHGLRLHHGESHRDLLYAHNRFLTKDALRAAITENNALLTHI
jgi:pimeloyl-ACP methyl ester carboxylesterase